MFVEATSFNPPSAEARRPPTMKRNFKSVGEELPLVPYFKCNTQEVLAFIGNVDTTFAFINPVQEDVLCKYVLTQINGEPRTAISYRNLNNWAELN
jgi:hypothetical protein